MAGRHKFSQLTEKMTPERRVRSDARVRELMAKARRPQAFAIIDEELVESPTFRFGLRSLLLLVTGFCLIAGMFWFVSLVLLLLFGVLAAQCVFFLVVQRLVIWIAGDPDR